MTEKPIHPGEILREEFPDDAVRLAPIPGIDELLRERTGVTPQIATTLANKLGTTEQFWLNLQIQYMAAKIADLEEQIDDHWSNARDAAARAE